MRHRPPPVQSRGEPGDAIFMHAEAPQNVNVFRNNFATHHQLNPPHVSP